MRPCLVCGFQKPVPLFKKHGFDLWRCPACGFSFVDPIPDRAYLQQHYRWDYFHGSTTLFGYLDYGAERANRQAAFVSKVSYLQRQFPQGGRLLDIGCADGSFLDMLDSTWTKEGVELSSDMVEKMPPALRANVFQGFVEDFPGPENAYDAITLWDVLDHVQDPLALLKKVARLLKPGGMLGMITGDQDSAFARLCGSRWYIYVPPAHLSYFSRKSIQIALEKAGLRIEKRLYEGKPVSLRLCFFRLRYILSGKWLVALMDFLWNKTPDRIRFPINFFDIMTLWARKP